MEESKLLKFEREWRLKEEERKREEERLHFYRQAERLRLREDHEERLKEGFLDFVQLMKTTGQAKESLWAPGTLVVEGSPDKRGRHPRGRLPLEEVGKAWWTVGPTFFAVTEEGVAYSFSSVDENMLKRMYSEEVRIMEGLILRRLTGEEVTPPWQGKSYPLVLGGGPRSFPPAYNGEDLKLLAASLEAVRVEVFQVLLATYREAEAKSGLGGHSQAG